MFRNILKHLCELIKLSYLKFQLLYIALRCSPIDMHGIAKKIPYTWGGGGAA